MRGRTLRHRLLAAARTSPGRFAHTLATERQARARIQARAAAEMLVNERGVRLIDRPTWQDEATPLDHLRHDGAPFRPAKQDYAFESNRL